MKPKSKHNYASCIRDIEEKFAENYISINKGWGQFLDGRIEHRTTQYGRYGTASGAIVLAVSGKQNEQISSEVKSTLKNYFWDKVNTDKHSQNLVLANLFAGMACLNYEDNALSKELEEILYRRTTAGLWGNYWKGPEVYDQTESVFVSSIILIAISCLSINGNFPQSKTKTITQSLEKLESLYLEHIEKHLEYQEVVLSALGRYDFYKPSNKTIKQLKTNSTSPIDISKKHIYFYDYEKEESKVGREYYVVPKEIFSVLAGASRHSPASYTLRSIKAANALKDNVKYNNGLYISSAGTRASTLEQGYLVLAFNAISHREHQKAISIADKFIYNTRIEREEKFYLFTALVIIAYALSLFNSYLMAFNRGAPGEIEMMLVTSSIFVIATIRDPKKLLATLIGTKR